MVAIPKKSHGYPPTIQHANDPLVQNLCFFLLRTNYFLSLHVALVLRNHRSLWARPVLFYSALLCSAWIDNFIQEQGNLGQTQKGHTGEKSVNRDEGDATGRIAQELMNATTAGMKNKASYKRAKQFYALLSRRVIDKMGDAPAKTSSTISGVDKTGEKSTAPPTELVGKRVRDIYSLEEESFILSVLQTHLRDSKDSGTDDIPMSFDDDEGEAMGNICSNATEIAVLLGAQESKKNVHAGVLLFGEESNVHSWEGTPRATALKKTP